MAAGKGGPELAAHGEGGGQKKTGKVPLSSRSTHHGTGKADGSFATPPPMEVKYFHKFADTDASDQALHHTLGSSGGQASPGDHKHDGGTSPFLLDQFTISGVRGTSAYYQSIEAALAAIGVSVTASG